jgi:hypothetical protein
MTPAPYAKGTAVDAGRTKYEIETMLRKRGARSTAMAQSGDKAMVVFELQDRQVRFVMPLPAQPPPAAARMQPGREDLSKRWEQACKERWRAMLLAIKSKFVSIDSGVESFEEAWMAHIVVGGATLGQRLLPDVAQAYRDPEHKLPPLLPGGQS